MTHQQYGTAKPTRRRALGSCALALALGLAGGGALAQSPFPEGTTLTYWGGLIFSDEANQLLVDEITAWGDANGVETEVVMINQNETVQRVSAGVAAGTMPDAMDMSNDLMQLLARQDVFVPLDDLYAEIGAAQGDWYDAVAAATDTTPSAGARYGVPFGVSGNLLLRRIDLTEPAGFAEPPSTWAELAEQAAAVQAPPVFGLGLALSNVGDANVQLSVMQSYGGRIADDAGTTVTIVSDETRAYLEWLESAWDQGLFPPGNTTWDGGGDNQAYLSGQAAFIANTGSVGIAARNDDPELFEASAFSSLPAGPMGTISPIAPQVRVIPATSSNVEAAKALILHLASPDFMDAYFKAAIYGPVLQGQAELPAFDGSDAIRVGLLDLVENGTAPGYPDVYNAAFAEVYTTFIIPRMAQRVTVDDWDLDRAMEEAQEQAQAIYDKY